MIKSIGFILFFAAGHMDAMEMGVVKPCPPMSSGVASDKQSYYQEVWYLAQGFGRKGLLNIQLVNDLENALKIIRDKFPHLKNSSHCHNPLYDSIIIYDFKTSDIKDAARKMDTFLQKRGYETCVSSLLDSLHPALYIRASKKMDVPSFVKFYNQKQSQKNGIGGKARLDNMATIVDEDPVEEPVYSVEFAWPGKKLFQFTFTVSNKKQIIFFDPKRQEIVSRR